MKRMVVIVLSLLVFSIIFSEGTENIMSELGYSAALTGKGETGQIFSNSASIIKTNPALISLLESSNIVWTHSELNYSQWNDYIASAIPVEKGDYKFGIGLSWNRLWIDGIPVTQEGDTIDGTNFTEIIYSGNTNMTLNEYGIALSATKCCFSIGILAKYEQGSILNYTVKGFGFDAGITMKKEINKSIINTVGTAIVIKDIAGTRLFWNTGYEESTAMTAEISGGLSFNLPKMGDDVLNIEGVLSKNITEKSIIGYKVGCEFYVLPMVPIRVGYNGNSVTAGIGISTEYINVDYSFSGMNELEPVHKISIGLTF